MTVDELRNLNIEEEPTDEDLLRQQDLLNPETYIPTAPLTEAENCCGTQCSQPFFT